MPPKEIRENIKQYIFNFQFRRRINNFFRCKLDFLLKNNVAKSFPYNASLNTTNICNLRCKFCEIHYFYKKAIEVSGKVFPNHVDVEILKKHDEWLKYIVGLHLSSATGEPFTNPNISEIIWYLKKYGIKLSADTNGLLINEKLAEQLVKSKFESLTFSIHGGDSKSYKYLQGGNFNDVIANLETLICLKKKSKSDYPIININFALNKVNAHSLKDLMQLSKDMGIDTFTLNAYYDSRNALEKDISYYFDVKECNILLKDTYDYARKINLKIVPINPSYLSNFNLNSSVVTHMNPCNAPWTSIRFKGCVEHENCEYIGVCNRIMLFKIDYRRFYEYDGNSFLENIWNHKVLQYLRESVNSKNSNPICTFCRDPNTPAIRCIDNVEYSHRRDKAIEEFFNEFRNRYEVKEVPGLILLNENPYKYDEKDGF